MYDDFSDQSIVARLFYPQEFMDGNFSVLFDKLTQFGVYCLDPLTKEAILPTTYHKKNPTEYLYSLSINSHLVIMIIMKTHNILHFRIGLDYRENNDNEDSIKRLSQLVSELFESFNFSFAHINLGGDSPVGYSDYIENLTIRWIFWQNYFGKTYIEKYGKCFLSKAPGWGTVEMSNGTIQYSTTSDPRLPPTSDMTSRIKSYFGSVNEIEIYSPEYSDLDL